MIGNPTADLSCPISFGHSCSLGSECQSRAKEHRTRNHLSKAFWMPGNRTATESPWSTLLNTFQILLDSRNTHSYKQTPFQGIPLLRGSKRGRLFRFVKECIPNRFPSKESWHGTQKGGILTVAGGYTHTHTPILIFGCRPSQQSADLFNDSSYKQQLMK